MKKIKELVKRQYLFIMAIVFATIAISMGLLLFLNRNIETKVFKENTYTMYVNTEPTIKLTIKESFHECTKKNITNICSVVKNEVIDYQMLDDKENPYQNIDFKGLTFAEAIAKLVEIDTSKPFAITTNYKIPTEELKEAVLSYTIKTDFDIVVHFEEIIDENTLLEKASDTYYTITFDCNGGNSMDSIVVKEGEVIEKPNNPTRDGYSFKEWQVDNTTFDFTTKVYNNLTLKAIWDRKTTTTTSTPSTSTSTPTQTKKDTINLNDNVVVTEYTKYASGTCSFYVFATNLKQLFPSVKDHWCPYPKEQCMESELAMDDYNNNFNAIQFDTNKENEIMNLLKQYKNGNYPGLIINSYDFNSQHFLTLDYQYLQIHDNRYYLEGSDGANKLQNLLKGATKLYGNCGATDFNSNKVLTEELCNQYHLKCDRW